MARTFSSGGITATNLREIITMVVMAAREAGQADCASHLLQARDAVTFGSCGSGSSVGNDQRR